LTAMGCLAGYPLLNLSFIGFPFAAKAGVKSKDTNKKIRKTKTPPVNTPFFSMSEPPFRVACYLVPIHKWLFSAISASGSDFNPRNTTMYSCG
jgi:hypothetical protein